MTAYVDESLRLGGDGLYVLAAVVVPDARADDVRAALRDAVSRGLRRYHWRRESPASRAAMCAVIRRLALDAVVVTGPVDAARQERARRRCLTRLLWELDSRDVARVVFETRQDRDALDAEIVRLSRRAGWVSRALRYEFAAPDKECLLWVADVVAGAVRSVADGQAAYLEALGEAIAVVTVP